MGAAVVAARDEQRCLRRNALEGIDDIARVFHVSGVALGSDQNEVVVHDVVTLDTVAARDESRLAFLVVDEENVGIATLAKLQGLTGANGYHADSDTSLRLENWQQILEEARLFGRRGRRNGNERLLGSHGRDPSQREHQSKKRASLHDLPL